MITATLKKFRLLPKETRAMVFLYWVYDFAEVLVGIFIGIFIFLETQSLLHLAMYNAVYFFGIMLGFCTWGYIMSLFQISMRLNYIRAFATYIVSFLILIFLPHTFPYLLLFALINGTGLGMFWIGVHSYEMLYTEDKNRDFYSSMTSAGAQSFAVIGPAIATLTFYISEKILHIETFQLLFIILPFIYTLSLPFLFSLPDFIPEKIPTKEWKRIIKDKKMKKAIPYFLSQGSIWGLFSAIYPLITIVTLGTVINVGMFETIVGILGIIAVIFLSHKRHSENRVQIMTYAIITYVIAYTILLFWKVHPLFFIIYHLIVVFVYPIYRVSEHTIDLKTIEETSTKNGFFSSMIYRDLILWLARTISVGVIILLIITVGESLTIQISILLMIFANALVPITAQRFANHVKISKHDQGFIGDEDDRHTFL